MATGKVKVYSFRLHAPGEVGPVQLIKGTADAIRDRMMSEPIEGSEEVVDASALDVYGFARPPEQSQASSKTT